jgi:hypothetical protein
VIEHGSTCAPPAAREVLDSTGPMVSDAVRPVDPSRLGAACGRTVTAGRCKRD